MFLCINFYFYFYFSVYDATGKIGSGILRGNAAQLGDYDGCLEISNPKDRIKGQYCLASLYIDTRSSSSKFNQNILDLILSHRALHSTPDEVSMFNYYY